MRVLCLLITLFFFTSSAFAACTSPAGVASQTRYDSSANKLYYCNDADWVEMGGGSGGGVGSNWSPNLGYAWAGPILFQWGRACMNSGQTIYVALPITFPNAIMQVVGQTDTAHHGAQRANQYVDVVNNSTILAGKGGLNGCINWLAIGH